MREELHNRAGYKKTKLGWIPNEWSVKRFTDFSELIHGFQFRKEHFVSQGIPVIKIGSLEDSKGINFNGGTFVDPDTSNQYKRFRLYKGDVLMALTGGTLGKVAIVQGDFGEILQNYRVGKFEPIGNTSKIYLFHLLQSFFVQQRVKNLVNEAAQPNFGKQDFDKIWIPLPPLPEQQKIAAILSKWDELIDTQTQLIAAKEKQKKSLMQKLLTGEVRFPGFDSKWKPVTLGEIAEFSNGKAHENIVDENGQYKLITSKFISTEGKEFRRLKNRLTPLFKNDIVMVMSDIPNGKALGKCYLVEQDDVYSLNQRIGRFVIKKHDSRFMYYLLNRNSHFLAFDSGVGQTNLRKDDILECPLFIPEVKEQEKIATTLSVCDEELQLLKDELEAIQLQKKGLMQQLLTGKIRVKI